MFPRASKPHKNGKDPRYDCVVENRRLADGRHVPKPRLYLGEINDSQKEPWGRTLDAIEERHNRQLSLCPQDWPPPGGLDTAVQIRLWELRRRRPRQWGACWLTSKSAGKTLGEPSSKDSSTS